MKKTVCLSAALLLCIGMTSCQSAVNADMLYSGTEKYYAGSYYDSSDMALQTTAVYNYEANFEQESIYQDIADMPSAAGLPTSGTDAVLTEEKLIYTVNIALETETFETAMESLHQTVSGAGGIIISESAYNLGGVNPKGSRTLNLTVKIPMEKYTGFLDGLSTDYNVARLQSNVENLTARYYDNENRLKSYRIQEERLFEMLEAAETVYDMLEIESRLSDVQYQIEALENTQRTIDTDVAYATFYVTLEEVTKYTPAAPKNFGERVADAVSDSIENFGEVLEGLLIALLYLLPYLCILAILLAVILIGYKHARKRRQKQRTAAENQPPHTDSK